ncbi:MAG: hypothetical protein ACRDNK_03680 [Solirubrobacteraceae bacterium]
MTEHEASRTLVKSTPELWAECSDAASLAKHLGAFGEIRITKLEPETAVAWEGEDVRGTVTLEPSGWGTRVILTAVPRPGAEAVDEQAIAEAPVADTPEEPPPEALLPEPLVPEPASCEPVLPEPVESEPASYEPVLPEPGEPEAWEAETEEPEVTIPNEPAAAIRPGFFRRLFGGRRRATRPVADEPRNPEPVAVAQARHQPEERGQAEEREEQVERQEAEELQEAGESVAGESVAMKTPAAPTPTESKAPPSEPAAVALAEALDSLGRAHHRPYSRG